jgi:hypothetical protein
MDDDWCDYSGHPWKTKDDKRPSHVRCPKCRRRLIPQTKNCEPSGFSFDIVYMIPPHKKPHKKRPSKKKKVVKKEKKGRIR